MKEIRYEFEELDSDTCFRLLGSSFNGILKDNSLYFDNAIVKGELIKKNPEEGLWIRKWHLTVFEKITLQKLSATAERECKYSLLYFLNPDLFLLKKKLKRIPVNCQHNKLFFSNHVPIDFSVVPKQPFYVLDIGVTAMWLEQQFADAEPYLKTFLAQCRTNTKAILAEPCTPDDYKILHELEVSLLAETEDPLFIRSRIYQLICTFFNNALHEKDTTPLHATIDYDRMIEVETIIRKSVQALPKLDAIAKSVNMSVSSLLRQFRMMYGKSIYEYYIELKMELAKRLLLEERMPVKELANRLGYKQASPFIEAFTKFYGYSPGSLKAVSN